VPCLPKINPPTKNVYFAFTQEKKLHQLSIFIQVKPEA
jgi:hypothetical protein